MNFKKDNIVIDNNLYDLYIGKNAIGNDEIIKICHQDSLWFHINEISSAHMILDSRGIKIAKKQIVKIARMLLNTKKNLPKNISVIYTQVKNVELTHQAGKVIAINTKIIKM